MTASLSPQQRSTWKAIELHTQLMTSQVRRLLYDGTRDGARVRCNRHLARLTKLGLIRRQLAVYDGEAEFLYQPVDTDTGGPVFHTLDVSELYVRLFTSSEAMSTGRQSSFIFDREPWCHIQVGHVTLNPDAYVKFSESEQYFIEMERSYKDRAKLRAKLRRYANAFEEWDTDVHGPVFPRVIFCAHEGRRLRLIADVIKNMPHRALFAVVPFDEVVAYLVKNSY